MDAESLQIVAYEETIRILTDQITRRNQLIAELCDAMEFYAPFSLEPHYRALVERAREATR